jgi:hypothetical protein
MLLSSRVWWGKLVAIALAGRGIAASLRFSQ